MMLSPIIVLMAGLIFLITAAFSAGAGLLLMQTSITDDPDGVRKLQKRPVVRLGGVAIALTLFLSAPLAIVGQPLTPPVLAFVLAAFLLGLWDDLLTAPTRLKLLLLALFCFGTTSLGLYASALPTPFGTVTAPLALIIGSGFWLLVFTNAANFMDGSNGLAIGSLAIMLTGLCIIGLDQDVFALSFWWITLLGATAGFLIHNLRGTLYAGDAGALSLGALFASLGLLSGLEVWTVATLALPFLIDVLMTLIWRARHGRSWLEAHLDHAYQRLRASGWSHLETAFIYWGLTVVCALAAYIAGKAGGEAPFAIFWTLCLSGIVLWNVHRKSIRSKLRN